MPAAKPVRHTKASVIARVLAEHRALESVLRKLGPRDFARPAMREEAPIRFTAKDVLAHMTAWKWAAERSLTKTKGPRRPFDPPKTSNITDTNAGIYKRSHRLSAADVIAEHRAAHRATLTALRALPSTFFSGRDRSPSWPFDAVGHLAEHRRKHLEPLVAARKASARKV